MEKEEKKSRIKTIGKVVLWTAIIGSIVTGIHALAHAFAFVRWTLFYLLDWAFGSALTAKEWGCMPMLLFIPFEYVLCGFLFGYQNINQRIAEHWIWGIVILVVLVVVAIASDVERSKQKE